MALLRISKANHLHSSRTTSFRRKAGGPAFPYCLQSKREDVRKNGLRARRRSITHLRESRA